MKLVKIEDCWINLDAIVSVRERNSIENEPGTQVCLTNGDAVFFDSSIEKVLQAIEGSQEHSITSNDGKDIYSKKYITSSNLMAKDDATIKKNNAEDIKSREIGISFDSNGTAIINAKKIKLNGVDLQNLD
ncbi:hypothetical protein [Pediococcus inopinatus]|uniref:hypothetical protein n=1 Tax=Pediococcus inopinatus TaxID=114090 RepID=UPI0007C5DA38|nr:hypothetical protein [Pediococcus inopinatus]